VLLLLAQRCDTCCEYECVDGDFYIFAEDDIVCFDGASREVGEFCVFAIPEEFDTEAACLVVEFLAESVCPDILVDDGHVCSGVLHLDLDCVTE